MGSQICSCQRCPEIRDCQHWCAYPRRMWNATQSILTGLLGTRSVESPSVFKSVTLILNLPTSYISVERGFDNVLAGISYYLQMFTTAIEPALAETAPRQS